MVILKNIKKNGYIIEFDYFPEGDEEKGYIKYNYDTKEVIEYHKTSVDSVMDYVGHGQIAIERYIEKGVEIPETLCEMWY